MRHALILLLLAACHWTTCSAPMAQALEYPYAPYNEGKMDPQKTGWPCDGGGAGLCLESGARPPAGSRDQQALPAMWPVTPSAGFWGGTSWLDTHANLVKVAQASKGPIDVLLVGDSITMQWGAAWTKHFPTLKTVNIGIGGDKTQNVLWRLDHGGVDGLEPRAVRAADRQQQHVLHARDGHRTRRARHPGLRGQPAREVSPSTRHRGEGVPGARAGQPVLRRHQEGERRAGHT